MPRFLSAQWFEDLDSLSPPSPGRGPGRPELVIEIVVTGAPEGEVRYQVVVDGQNAGACWHPDDLRVPNLTLRADYATVAGIAAGVLSPVEALGQGRARVSGSTAVLSQADGPAAGLPALASLDLLPPALRASTTFE